MKQSAYVKAVNGEKHTATVKVKRQSACDSCDQKTFCFGCVKTVTVDAYNDIGAKPGDTVTLETSSKNLLLYSVLNFILPIVAGIAAYLIAQPRVEEKYALIITLAAFFAVFFGMLAVSKLKSDKDLEIHITEITEFGALDGNGARD